jgi:hypothetical protein
MFTKVLLKRARTKVCCSNDPEQAHNCKLLLPNDVVGRLVCAAHRKDFTNMSPGIPDASTVHYVRTEQIVGATKIRNAR